MKSKRDYIVGLFVFIFIFTATINIIIKSDFYVFIVSFFCFYIPILHTILTQKDD